ncbi:MAG: hypothetical protein GY928_33770 [Colwellia sp.]|nr:hypothetical protein [Colwellia sp.]
MAIKVTEFPNYYQLLHYLNTSEDWEKRQEARFGNSVTDIWARRYKHKSDDGQGIFFPLNREWLDEFLLGVDGKKFSVLIRHWIDSGMIPLDELEAMPTTCPHAIVIRPICVICGERLNSQTPQLGKVTA